jgi:glycine cleavage system H protein
MSDKLYTQDHEWLVIEDGIATVGVTVFAQEQLGDVVFVDLPKVGTEVAQGQEAAVVESVKAASDVYAPIDGEVVETNAALVADPALVNQDPENAAWFFKLRVTDASQLDALMDEASYKAQIGV